MAISLLENRACLRGKRSGAFVGDADFYRNVRACISIDFENLRIRCDEERKGCARSVSGGVEKIPFRFVRAFEKGLFAAFKKPDALFKLRHG